MTQQIIVTTPTNSGNGTPLNTAFDYINANFTELYNNVQATPPVSSSGQAGDVPGMIAYDQEYLYVCVYEYDATTIIWYRIAFDTAPW